VGGWKRKADEIKSEREEKKWTFTARGEAGSFSLVLHQGLKCGSGGNL